MGLHFLPSSWTPVGCTNVFSSSYFRRKVLPFFSFHRADKAVHLQMWPPGLYCHSGNINFPSSSELHRPAATCLFSRTFSCLSLPIPRSSTQLIACVHVLIPSGSQTAGLHTAPPPPPQARLLGYSALRFCFSRTQAEDLVYRKWLLLSLFN